MTRTPLIGGPAAGDTTDSTERVIALLDASEITPPTPKYYPDPQPLKIHYYTRRLFGFQGDDGERTTVAFYAPEDWSDERAFYELLDGYRKA